MEQLKKLIDVKSIITIVSTIIFAYLAVAGKLEGNQSFLTIFTVIIGFYFGTQSQKKANEETTITAVTDMEEGE